VDGHLVYNPCSDRSRHPEAAGDDRWHPVSLLRWALVVLIAAMLIIYPTRPENLALALLGLGLYRSKVLARRIRCSNRFLPGVLLTAIGLQVALVVDALYGGADLITMTGSVALVLTIGPVITWDWAGVLGTMGVASLATIGLARWAGWLQAAPMAGSSTVHGGVVVALIAWCLALWISKGQTPEARCS
jgi:hypothetical protein